MKPSYFSKLLLLFLTASLLVSSVSAYSVPLAPADWDDQLKYLPYNSTAGHNVTITNSTYFLYQSHYMQAIPYEWVLFFAILGVVLMLIALLIERNNDITSLLSAVLFYITAYTSQFTLYRFYDAFYDMNTQEVTEHIMIVPWYEIDQIEVVGWVFLLLGIVMTVYFLGVALRQIHDSATKKQSWVDTILGKR